MESSVTIDVKVVDTTPEPEPDEELSTIITDGTLGELADKTDATITSAINSKFPAAIGKFTLSAITENTAVATGKNGYKGTVYLNFTIQVVREVKVTEKPLKTIGSPLQVTTKKSK